MQVAWSVLHNWSRMYMLCYTLSGGVRYSAHQML